MGSNPGGRLVDATTCCGLTAVISMATFRKLARMDVVSGPQALGVSPASVAASTTGITLTVTGTGFVAEDIIQLDGADQQTGYSGPTTLVAINVVAKATPGTMAVTVRSSTQEIKGTGELQVT